MSDQTSETLANELHEALSGDLQCNVICVERRLLQALLAALTSAHAAREGLREKVRKLQRPWGLVSVTSRLAHSDNVVFGCQWCGVSVATTKASNEIVPDIAHPANGCLWVEVQSPAPTGASEE